MRVMMITESVSRRAGGLFTSVRRLSQALARDGIDVAVISFADPDTDSDLAAWLPLEPIILPAGGSLLPATMFQLGRRFSAFKPDVIHQHGIWLPFSGRVAWESRLGTPVIISPRGMLDPWALANSGRKKWLAWTLYERRNLRRAACLHSLAAAESDAIRAKLPEAQIATIPNGIDMPESESKCSLRDLGSESTKDARRTLLFIGRIHPKKGLYEMVNAWKLLGSETRARWQVVVAGPDEGGHRGELEQLVASYGLQRDVRFVGPVFGRDKARLLRCASAFVLPSKSEGLPIAVLEAWAYGLPVLMTSACNLPEGFEVGAALELGQMPISLESALLRSDAEFAEIGARGRSLVRERFSWKTITREHISVYEWVVGRRARPGCVSL